jgi:hypothetical protein
VKVKNGKKVRKPGSVLGNHLSGPSAFKQADIERPTRRNGKRTVSFFPEIPGKNSFLHGLAPERVFQPLLFPKARWALTPPFHSSPRLFFQKEKKGRAEYSLWHFPSPRQRGALAYRKVSCPVVPGLSSSKIKLKRLPDLLSLNNRMTLK